jgi:hypothetical protein
VRLTARGRRETAPTSRIKGETAASRSIPRLARRQVPTEVPTIWPAMATLPQSYLSRTWHGLWCRGVPLACGGIELCLYRCGVPTLWRGARFLFAGTRAGRDEETSSRKYEPVRYWSGAHLEPRGWQLASYWGSAFHIARYPKPGKSLIRPKLPTSCYDFRALYIRDGLSKAGACQ